MFTNQHYRVVANILKHSGLGCPELDNLVNMFVVQFSIDNARFNENKFKEIIYGRIIKSN